MSVASRIPDMQAKNGHCIHKNRNAGMVNITKNPNKKQMRREAKVMN